MITFLSGMPDVPGIMVRRAPGWGLHGRIRPFCADLNSQSIISIVGGIGHIKAVK